MTSMTMMATIFRRATASLWMAFLAMTIAFMSSLGKPHTSRDALSSSYGLTDLVETLSSLEILSELARLATIALAAWLLLATSACFLLSRVSLEHDGQTTSETALRRASRRSHEGRDSRPTRLLFAVRRLSPGFVVAIAASSVVSAGIASASPGGADPHPSRDRRSSEPPTMELLTPPPGVQTYMPWGPTIAGDPGSSASPSTHPSASGASASGPDSPVNRTTGVRPVGADPSGSETTGPIEGWVRVPTTTVPTTTQPGANVPGPIPEAGTPALSEPTAPTMELLDQEEPKPDRPPTSEPGDTLTTRRAKERPSSDPVFLSPWLSPTWSTDDGAAPSVSNEGSIQSPTPGPNQEAETSTAGASNSPNEASIHVVSPGEHLWSIAEETIRQRLGSDVDSKQIGAYWQTLIEENRDRLADPGNPDFILPGQELKLPA